MSRIQHDSRLHQCGWKLGLWMGWIASWWWAGISYRGTLRCRYWRNHRRRWRVPLEAAH